VDLDDANAMISSHVLLFFCGQLLSSPLVAWLDLELRPIMWLPNDSEQPPHPDARP